MRSRHLAMRTVVVSSAAAVALALGAAAPAQAKPRQAEPTGTSPVLVAGGLVAPLQLAAPRSGREIYAVDAFASRVVEISVSDSATATATATVPVGIDHPASIAFRGHQLWVVGSQDDGTTHVARVSRGGLLSNDIDLLAFERQANPDRQVPSPPSATPTAPGEEPEGDAESNPYDVIAYRGGLIVADAAANALIRISPRGTPSVLTAFPLVTRGSGPDDVMCSQVFQPRVDQRRVPGCDPVPTGLALGPDGYLYVSGLGAFAAGQVWKVDPRSGRIVQNITDAFEVAPPFTDIAVDRNGAVYLASPFAGAVFRLQGGQLSAAELPGAASLLISNRTLYVGTAPVITAEPAGPPPATGAVYALPSGAFSPVTVGPATPATSTATISP